jgi:glycosyltransferase 2 family protein
MGASMKKFSTYLKLVLKFGFSFAIIGYMVASGRLDLATVRKGFSEAHLIAFCAMLLITAQCIAMFRWGLLLRAQGLVYPPKKVVRYSMIGAFFNTTMPGAVSGDLIKAWYVVNEHKGQKKTPVLSSIFVDRVFGIMGLVLVSASPLLLNWKAAWELSALHQLYYLVLSLSFGVFLFFLLLFLAGIPAVVRWREAWLKGKKSRGSEIVNQLFQSWNDYRKTPLTVIFSLLLSLGTHLLVAGTVFLCSRAVGEGDLPTFLFFLLVPLGLLTTAIPIAPGGLGVGHAAFGFLFTLAGSSHGAEIFTLFVTMQILINLTGVFFYLGGPKGPPSVAV